MRDHSNSASDVPGVLADRRRRQTLNVLDDIDTPVSLRELAVAVSEAGPGEASPGEPTLDGGTSLDAARPTGERAGSEPVRSVAIDLYHVHLPKLEAAGFLTFDPGTREITDLRLDGPPGVVLETA